MAPLSSIPEGTLMPPPRPPDLHTPTTGVEVRMVERQLKTSNKALATPRVTSELSPKSPPATSERVLPPSLKMLRRGFHWKWLKEPPPLLFPKLKNIQPQPDLYLEIQLLLLKGAIYEVPYQPCFISRIFLVPKSRRGNRLIIDLSSLNSHILAPYFHMHNHKRNQCHRLFRRLGHLGHFSRIDSKGCQHSDQPSEQPRLPHQHPKVPPPPFNRRGMVRDSLVPPIRMLGASGGQTNVHPVIHKACSITKTSLTQAMGTYSRQTQLCHPNTTPQSTPATTTLAPPNSFKPLAPRRSEATASKLSQTPVTLATSKSIVNFPPFPPLRKHDPPLDRCFPFRLGRSHSISSGLRHLVQEQVNLAHKLSRSSSSPSLHSVTQPFKLPTSSIYRQSSSAMCNKQAMMQINLSVTRNFNSQQPSQLSQNSHTCFQDFFPSKFKGGQPEQTFKHLNRVVTSKTNLQADSNLERPIRNRSNDNMQKQEATSVLLPSSRPKGSCLERAGPRLEQMESNLSLPSKMVTPSGAEETGILPSPRSDNSSLVSNGALVQLNTEQVNRPDATQPRRSHKEWVACIREMDRLQFLRTSLSTQHDEDIASHLSAAYRASTTRQAQSNWKVFQQWLLADISDITENVILQFLIYLDEPWPLPTEPQNWPPPSGKESRSPTDKQPYLSKDNFFSKIKISIINLHRPSHFRCYIPLPSALGMP
ncbi:hypothetical protein Pcinc_001693 [Petrolisthes cinctipes]|uniref:Uncharacterized protein n=1 Tax=Petrolisthes cinctipes TaxID=88211 RepID=A0AAE1GL29_PETCI|nr:hypothetical protein Pcinc_001693 [Petrolisthes cinctipes]